MALGHWAVEYLGEGNGQGGSGGGGLVVHVTESEEGSTTYHTLDQTWQTIHDALAAGVPVMLPGAINWGVSQQQIYEAYFYNDAYTVIARSPSGANQNYTVDDPDGYAYYTSGGK